MKILSLKVDRYKNLKNIDLSFDPNHLVTLLVGRNGLGKSNLIEILALIFRDLRELDQLEAFEQWPYKLNHFSYILSYRKGDKIFRFQCAPGLFQVSIKSTESGPDFEEVKFKDFIKSRNDFLPRFILGYYSGENKRLGEVIQVFETEEKKRFKTKASRETSKSREQYDFRPLLFFENLHAQMVLVTLALYRNHVEFEGKIARLFRDFLNIEKIAGVSFRFQNPDWSYEKIRGVDKSAHFLTTNFQNGIPSPFWNAGGSVDDLLALLYDHQVDRMEPLVYGPEDEPEVFPDHIRELLEFNAIDLEVLSEQVHELFPHPRQFLASLEASEVIGIFNRVVVQMKKKDADDVIAFAQMSEGEQQLLAVLGLILLTGQNDCLFLLDEPDTHLNPRWQRDYVHLLHEFNLNDDNSHILVATHSPMIVQASADCETVLFSRDEAGKPQSEVASIPYRRWRTDHVLTSKYFGLESARPPDAELDAYMKRREEILKQETISTEDHEYLESMIDEGGLLPSGETYNDMVAMQIIRQAALKVKRENDSTEGQA